MGEGIGMIEIIMAVGAMKAIVAEQWDSSVIRSTTWNTSDSYGLSSD